MHRVPDVGAGGPRRGHGLRAPGLVGREALGPGAGRGGAQDRAVALALQPALHVPRVAALLELELVVVRPLAHLLQELPLVVAVAEAGDGNADDLSASGRQALEREELALGLAFPGREALAPLTQTVEAAVLVRQSRSFGCRVTGARRQEEVGLAGVAVDPGLQGVVGRPVLRRGAAHAPMQSGGAPAGPQAAAAWLEPLP
mmetsp:Transcript_70105/g.226871  ORF Transcript_70105/g.226871 Transcript_70105/m.226871 type:complete len:201 (-) Transcript_70105:2-604(-)